MLYGAPAVGKRTVGMALSGWTGWKLHHDHMAADLAVALFAFDDPRFLALRHRIHLEALDAAAAGGLPGLIFAYCVGGAWDDPFIADLIKRFGADACFTRLECDPAEQERRVTGADRRTFRKMTDAGALQETMQAVDFSKRIAHPAHLDLDTTGLTAAQAAQSIAGHFHLPVRH